MKRIEKLSSFHDDHWIVIRDMGDKLNEVIEAINTLTERLAEHIDHEARHVSEPTQVEPDKSQAFLDKAAKMQGTYTSTGSMVWWDSWENLCKVHIYAHPDYGTRVEWSDGKVEQL